MEQCLDRLTLLVCLPLYSVLSCFESERFQGNHVGRLEGTADKLRSIEEYNLRFKDKEGLTSAQAISNPCWILKVGSRVVASGWSLGVMEENNWTESGEGAGSPATVPVFIVPSKEKRNKRVHGGSWGETTYKWPVPSMKSSFLSHHHISDSLNISKITMLTTEMAALLQAAPHRHDQH